MFFPLQESDEPCVTRCCNSIGNKSDLLSPSVFNFSLLTCVNIGRRPCLQSVHDFEWERKTVIINGGCSQSTDKTRMAKLRYFHSFRVPEMCDDGRQRFSVGGRQPLPLLLFLLQCCHYHFLHGLTPSALPIHIHSVLSRVYIDQAADDFRCHHAWPIFGRQALYSSSSSSASLCHVYADITRNQWKEGGNGSCQMVDTKLDILFVWGPFKESISSLRLVLRESRAPEGTEKVFFLSSRAILIMCWFVVVVVGRALVAVATRTVCLLF